MDRRKTVACLIGAGLTASSCRRGERIVVASKNFTEQVLLGEILAQQVERRLGVPVEHKLNLGGTLLTHEALVAGSIDLYPEYTGTALTAILKQPPAQDASQVLARVRQEYRRRWKISWLKPFGFNNTFAMVVRAETARALAAPALSAAAARPEPWKLGAGYEFLERPDGFRGLAARYGLRTDGNPVTMDLGLLYTALQSRKVEMAAANSTDGQLSILDVVVLADDRHYFPPYQCATLVRSDTLARYPKLEAALGELSGRITDAGMRRLNYEVEGRHRSVRVVAAEFLAHSDLNADLDAADLTLTDSKHSK